jgi:iron complex transport system substrate-binding protein
VLRHGIDGQSPGYEPWPQEAQAQLAAELAARPGWSELPAVQNGDVYVANNFWTSSVAKAIGALGLATWLHPDRFEDVDVDEYFTRWVEDFQETELEHGTSDYVYRLGDGE